MLGRGNVRRAGHGDGRADGAKRPIRHRRRGDRPLHPRLAADGRADEGAGSGVAPRARARRRARPEQAAARARPAQGPVHRHRLPRAAHTADVDPRLSRPRARGRGRRADRRAASVPLDRRSQQRPAAASRRTTCSSSPRPTPGSTSTVSDVDLRAIAQDSVESVRPQAEAAGSPSSSRCSARSRSWATPAISASCSTT